MAAKRNLIPPTIVAEKERAPSKTHHPDFSEKTFFENLITKKQLAQHLSMSISFINKVMTQGLPCIRIGRAVRFRIVDVEEWLRRRFV